MNRLRCGRSSDSDDRSLHIAGPGQHAGPRHSTAPDGARRGTPAGRGWTGSKAETRGGPGRAGQRPKMYRWKLVTLQCQQTTVTELFRNDSTLLLRKESNRGKIDFRSSVMEITVTLDTSAHSCDIQRRRSNRGTDSKAGREEGLRRCLNVLSFEVDKSTSCAWMDVSRCTWSGYASSAMRAIKQGSGEDEFNPHGTVRGGVGGVGAAGSGWGAGRGGRRRRRVGRRVGPLRGSGGPWVGRLVAPGGGGGGGGIYGPANAPLHPLQRIQRHIRVHLTHSAASHIRVPGS